VATNLATNGTGAEEPATAEILRAVRRVRLRTRRAVSDMVAGGFRSVFRGSGMEFEEVREYVPGDDVRSIDWNVTARTGRPYVKKFVEEREQTVMLAVDVSASTRLGCGSRAVRQAASELAAILAFSAVGSGDRAGLLLFSDRIELELPPRGGLRQAFRVTREALYRPAHGTGTALALACDHLARVLLRRAHVFLLSDFLDEDWDRSLAMLHARHDVVALRLLDERHRVLPRAGLVPWRDPESGRLHRVDAGSRRVREAFAERAAARDGRLRQLLARRGVDLVDIPLRPGDVNGTRDDALVEPLIAWLRQRERRLR
jgi:uncharacterized protein (DUF58 family)